jgi:DNA-binding response OmpR family regulator
VNSTVLVVDDERDFAELMQFRLQEKGYRVVLADNGLTAIDQARRLLPDLILLDLMMPGLDGFSVCENLRRHPSTRSIPVIMLTATSGQIARLNGLDVGADDYLVKTASAREILLRVQRLLALRNDERRQVMELDQNRSRKHVDS